MAKRKKSLSSSEDSSSSSSDSDSTSSESPPPRQNKVKERHRSNEKITKGTVKSRGREKVDERRKRSPETRSSDRRRKQSESHNKSRSSKVEDRKPEVKKRSKSPDRSHKQRSRKERSKSPRVDTKKNLFPIVNKEDNVCLDLESGKKNITETTLVSYPNLNKSVTESKTKNEDDRKRRHTSPERFKSMSSTITVTHNSEPEKRPRRSPVQRSPVQRSLRDRVGWDPFQGTTSSSFGDHDDRQLNRGYNDSYTRKDFGRGRGRGRGFRGDDRPRMGGGLWSNNRTFSRNNHEISDRSGINDKKWKRDLFTDD